MEQPVVDLKIWKELAIDKQMMLRTVTDALSLDPDCGEAELKTGLEKGITQIAEADALVRKANQENAAAIAAMEKKLAASEKARTESEAAFKALQAEKQVVDAQLVATKESGTAEAAKLNRQLDKKAKELKNINVALADTPANVVKKLKTLNKKKFEEAAARKRIEDELKNLKKGKRELQTKFDSTSAQSTKLAEKYRELREVSEDHFTQLKQLSDDGAELTPLPILDEDLTKVIDEAA